MLKIPRLKGLLLKFLLFGLYLFCWAMADKNRNLELRRNPHSLLKKIKHFLFIVLKFRF